MELADYIEKLEVTGILKRTMAVMEIPLALVPVVRELLAQYYDDNKVPA